MYGCGDKERVFSRWFALNAYDCAFFEKFRTLQSFNSEQIIKLQEITRNYTREMQ